jgi:hypothetical protein
MQPTAQAVGGATNLSKPRRGERNGNFTAQAVQQNDGRRQ